MININTYIIEKLKINKESINKRFSIQNLGVLLKEKGKVFMEDIFNDESEISWPWTPDGYSIDSLYTVTEKARIKLHAICHDSIKGKDIDTEIEWTDLDEDQLKLIYNYLLD